MSKRLDRIRARFAGFAEADDRTPQGRALMRLVAAIAAKFGLDPEGDIFIVARWQTVYIWVEGVPTDTLAKAMRQEGTRIGNAFRAVRDETQKRAWKPVSFFIQGDPL